MHTSWSRAALGIALITAPIAARSQQVSYTRAEQLLDWNTTLLTFGDEVRPQWLLDGAPRMFVPGPYRLGAPVAVGTGGLAAPRGQVDFTADEHTTLAAAGGIVVRVPPRVLTLEGPGRIRTIGELTVVTVAGRRTATGVTFGPGAYRLVLRPAPGGVVVDGLLQGPAVIS